MCQKVSCECEKLKEEIAILKKNSGTSSKPPSSDITKPKSEQRRSGERKIGGQKGHPRHDRTPFTQDELDEVIDDILIWMNGIL